MTYLNIQLAFQWLIIFWKFSYSWLCFLFERCYFLIKLFLTFPKYIAVLLFNTFQSVPQYVCLK